MGHDRAGHRPDHLECDGCSDRQWRGIRKGPGFSFLSRCRLETEPSSGASPNGATVTCAQAARVILLRPGSWPKHGFGVWLARAAQRLHPNVLAAALANKLARIAWTVLVQERSYEARVTKAAA
jgi:hypothetical protein